MSREERRYTDEEFAEIIRRAGELHTDRQQLEPAPEGADTLPARGMTLEEITAIAREVGIEPDLVRRVATAVAAEEVVFTETSPDRFLLKRSVSGVLEDDDLARLLSNVRDAAGVHGETVSGVPGVEWRGGEVVKTVVSATSAGDETELRVAVDANAAKLLSYLFPGIAGLLAGVGVGATLEPGLAGGIAVMAGSIGAGLGVGRLIWKGVLTRIRNDAERLFRAGAQALPPG